MASKYLDMCPPVLASLKAGTPIIAIETGFFMQLPYPRNLEALQECEQAFYRRDCVPCCVGIVNGRLKAGLSKQDMDTLCRSGGSCTRSQIPALVGGGSTSGTGPSATLAIARMAGWSAHRMEELVNAGKIIRPAYASVAERRSYVPMKERK